MALEHPDDGLNVPGSCLVEVALPLRVNQKWVGYACRTAGVRKPKWNPIREVWTTSVKADDGVEESIAITGSGDKGIRIKVEWASADGPQRTTPSARRIISAIVTAMQWQVRRQSNDGAPSERQIHLR